LISLCIKNITNKFRLFQTIPLLIMLISLSVMYGWFVNSQSLVQIMPSFAPMQFNTALCFLLLSIGLITLNTRFRTLGMTVVLSASLISLLTLLQYICNSNYGIDMLFVDPFTETKTSNPGRMAPNTSIAMILTSIALYMSHSKNNITDNKYYIITVAIIGNLVFALGIVPVIGYLTDVEAAYGWSDLTRMAIHTAICFSLIGGCVLINLWTKSKVLLTWLSLTAGSGLLIVSLSLALAVSSQNKVSFNTGLSIHTNNLSGVMKTQLDHTYSALQRMQKRREASKNIGKAEWQSDVKGYMEEFSYISSMMLLDTNRNISMMGPLTSNIYELNKQLNIGDLEKAVLYKSISRYVSMPTNVFINSNDKKVFLYYLPLRINDKLDGVIAVEIETDSLFKKILENESLVLINILNDSNQMIYSDFPNNILKYNDFINAAEIMNGNITWTLESYPTVNSLSKRNAIIPWVVFIIGCITSILVSLSIFLGLKEKLNLEVISKQSEEQAKLLNIIDSLPDFIGISDLKGNLQYHNKSAKLLVGLPEDYDMSQKNIKDMHPSHIIEMMEKTIIPTVFKKDMWKGNSFLLHANGREIPVSQIITLYRDQNRSPVCFTTIMRDITEQNEIDRIKKEFISTVSHELRTPLTSIRGSLGLIIGSFSKDLPEKINKLLKIASNNSERLILLINDILDIDKIASGQMRFNMKEEIFSYITQQAVQENMSYAEKFNTNINLEPINKNIKINIDADRYAQVLSNLLSNAAKFSKSGGNIDVRHIKLSSAT
jgi:PAS domain S-box-containing protein